jgi:hypothetical protein
VTGVTTLVEVPEAPDRGVVSLERATVEGVDFRKASFAHLRPNGCVFVRCDFRGLVFDQRLQTLFTGRIQSVFRECRFDEADLRKATPGQSRFERCTFDGAVLTKWTSLYGEFVECHFAGRIEGARFYGRPHGASAGQLAPARTVNEFRGNDFRHTELVDALFVHGIQFGRQQWPEGPDHVRFDRIHQRLQRARLEAMRWTDPDQRTAGLEMILRLSTLYGEQTELVRVRRDAGRTPVEIQDQVWELVARPVI